MTLAEEGCSKLFLADLNLQGLEDTRRRILASHPEASVEICKVNIGDEASVDNMVSTCVGVFGRIDYALNLAGVVPSRTPIAQVDVETYDFIVGINQIGVSLTSRTSASLLLFSWRFKCRRAGSNDLNPSRNRLGFAIELKSGRW